MGGISGAAADVEDQVELSAGGFVVLDDGLVEFVWVGAAFGGVGGSLGGGVGGEGWVGGAGGLGGCHGALDVFVYLPG